MGDVTVDVVFALGFDGVLGWRGRPGFLGVVTLALPVNSNIVLRSFTAGWSFNPNNAASVLHLSRLNFPFTKLARHNA